MGRSVKPSGVFDPPVGRTTSVVVLKRYISEGREDVRIVMSLSTQASTEVFEIEGRRGSLQFASENIFTDEPTALASLSRQGFVEILRGSALLGYVASETIAGLFLATATMPKVMLPGGHIVHLIVEAQWILTPLDNTAHASVLASEQEFWKSIQQNTIGGTHFYCETADVSRPFPSWRGSYDPDLEFVWNRWLSKPLRDLGLVHHCPAMLQGAVESADEVHPTGQRYTIAMISRRSRRHPGTRYLARGLNSFAGPGNEIEVELIMWKSSTADGIAKQKTVDWCRVFWRRGTVPIWWGVEIQPLNKGLSAEVYVKDKGTYVGSLTYFRTLLHRAAEEAHMLDADERTPATQIQRYVESKESEDAVTCVNLLHCNPKKAAELMLSSHYQEGMRHVREKLGPKGAPSLRLINFDWHGTMGCLTEERGVEAFWHFVEQPVKHCGIASGTMVAPNLDDMHPDLSAWGEHWKMIWKSRQKGILRFNCADSLDRTNAASCFAMLPVVQEGLRKLGIPLDVTLAPAASMLVQRGKNVDPKDLPPGWEVRDHGGRLLYIDHNSRTTQWEHPTSKLHETTARHKDDDTSDSIGSEWSFFNYSLDDVRVRLYPDVIGDYISMFKKHGDVHSELYTGSAAMHSHILNIVLNSESKNYGSTSSVGKLQNLKVAVQRRWNNTISDAPRQQSIELFLGLHISKHCPGLSVSSLQPDDADDVFHSRLDEDEKEIAESKSLAHLGAELRSLTLKKHDGRLALQERFPESQGLEDTLGSDATSSDPVPHDPLLGSPAKPEGERTSDEPIDLLSL